MSTINKVTKLFPEGGTSLDEGIIQSHFDIENADGWKLVAVDNMVGWYRFFWSKEIE